MKQPKFSVVIPLYNKAEHILDTLDSVLKQHYPVQEIIVVDDGSQDMGPELVKNLNAEKVRLISQKNQGVSAARNRGIQAAKCKYVAFLDADDLWLPMFTEEMCNLIRKYPRCQLFASRYQCLEPGNNLVDAKIQLPTIEPGGMLLDNYFAIASKGDLPFMISSSVVQQSLFDEIGTFPLGEPIGEDQDFFVRAALHGPIAYCPNINLLYRREAQNSACQQNVPQQECPFSARLEQMIQASVLPAQHKLDARRYSAAHLCHLAKLNLQQGRLGTVFQLLSDVRCNLKPKHKWGLWCWASLLNCKQRLACLVQRGLQLFSVKNA